MPLIRINLLITLGYVIEDLPEAFFPVWGQRKRHVDSVYNPHQENLAVGPGAVPYLQIFQGQ